jgi:hypothetical protein
VATVRRRMPGTFVCATCGKAFDRSTKLRRHEAIHVGARPFACLVPGCGWRFGRRDHLDRHMLNRHSGKASVTPAWGTGGGSEDGHDHDGALSGGGGGGSGGGRNRPYFPSTRQPVEALDDVGGGPGLQCEWAGCRWQAPTMAALQAHVLKHVANAARHAVHCPLCPKSETALHHGEGMLAAHFRDVHRMAPEAATAHAVSVVEGLPLSVGYSRARQSGPPAPPSAASRAAGGRREPAGAGMFPGWQAHTPALLPLASDTDDDGRDGSGGDEAVAFGSGARSGRSARAAGRMHLHHRGRSTSGASWAGAGEPANLDDAEDHAGDGMGDEGGELGQGTHDATHAASAAVGAHYDEAGDAGSGLEQWAADGVPAARSALGGPPHPRSRSVSGSAAEPRGGRGAHDIARRPAGGPPTSASRDRNAPPPPATDGAGVDGRDATSDSSDAPRLRRPARGRRGAQSRASSVASSSSSSSSSSRSSSSSSSSSSSTSTSSGSGSSGSAGGGGTSGSDSDNGDGRSAGSDFDPDALDGDTPSKTWWRTSQGVARRAKRDAAVRQRRQAAAEATRTDGAGLPDDVAAAGLSAPLAVDGIDVEELLMEPLRAEEVAAIPGLADALAHQCPYPRCGQRFPNHRSLQRHTAVDHAGQVLHCSRCARPFQRPRSYHKHMAACEVDDPAARRKAKAAVMAAKRQRQRQQEAEAAATATDGANGEAEGGVGLAARPSSTVGVGRKRGRPADGEASGSGAGVAGWRPPTAASAAAAAVADGTDSDGWGGGGDAVPVVKRPRAQSAGSVGQPLTVSDGGGGGGGGGSGGGDAYDSAFLAYVLGLGVGVGEDGDGAADGEE